MSKLVVSVVLSAILFAICVLAEAQQAGKVHRIGFLASGSPPDPSQSPSFFMAFGQGLRELGYLEGQNFLLEIRYAKGASERLPSLAADLVKLKMDVIVASGLSSSICHRTADKVRTTKSIACA